MSMVDSFEPIGDAAARVVEKISPLGPVEKVNITSREQWLDVRRGFVTASDIGSLCGVGRRSPLAIWGEKTGRMDASADNAAMKKGRWFEPAIFQAIAETQPDWAVQRAGVFLAAKSHRLGATPDAVASVPGIDGLVIVQGKVVGRPQFREKWLTDPDDDASPALVPLEYQLQTITESMLAGAVTAYVAALVHDTYSADLYLIPVERHAGAERKIIERVDAFWADTDAGREPSIIPEKDASVVRALYPKDDGTEIDLSGDNELPDLIAQHEFLTDSLKESKKRKDAVDTQIKAKIGNASSAKGPGGRVITHKIQERGGYTVKPTMFRQLRIGKEKSI
ncbi:MAG TPA: YqaJ viral recombinase family protein [Pseudolabrys sp.]|nr:YqaJ viral recombinase family protein [Pseudolabrys sp.]